MRLRERGSLGLLRSDRLSQCLRVLVVHRTEVADYSKEGHV